MMTNYSVLLTLIVFFQIQIVFSYFFLLETKRLLSETKLSQDLLIQSLNALIERNEVERLLSEIKWSQDLLSQSLNALIKTNKVEHLPIDGNFIAFILIGIIIFIVINNGKSTSNTSLDDIKQISMETQSLVLEGLKNNCAIDIFKKSEGDYFYSLDSRIVGENPFFQDPEFMTNSVSMLNSLTL